MNLQLTETPTMKTAMLIRRPIVEVFEAFVNPDVATKFWFTKSDGRLEAGKTVQWQWEMYDISIPVTVKAVEADRQIVVEWEGYNGPTTVEWIFESQPDNTTFVRSTETGFIGNGDQLVKQVSDSTEVFCWVLAGLKALLEHDVRLNSSSRLRRPLHQVGGKLALQTSRRETLSKTEQQFRGSTE